MTPEEYFFYFQHPDLTMMEYFRYQYIWDGVYDSLRDPMSYDRRAYLFYLRENFFLFKGNVYFRETYEHTVYSKAKFAAQIDPYNIKYFDSCSLWARPYKLPTCLNSDLMGLLYQVKCPPTSRGLVAFSTQLDPVMDNFFWQHFGKNWFYPNLAELPNNIDEEALFAQYAKENW